MTPAAQAYLAAVARRGRAGLRTPRARAWFDASLAAAASHWPRDRRLDAWEAALDALPALAPVRVDLAGDVVTLRAEGAVEAAARATLEHALRALVPWRKGPFDLFGVAVDAEWRSDRKWRRVSPHLSPLAGRAVLDVGCGNGYYLWRMLGAGARLVVGLDPAALALVQFRAVQRYLPDAAAAVLPLGSAALHCDVAAFDTVFSMGVLYHRRQPLDHLRELRRALRVGGELVLETLVVPGAVSLVPDGRYARMPNVWIVPALSTVLAWLAQGGFEAARCVDLTPTTPAEQRSTAWMPFESLAQCLAADDPTRTVEGHPAPLRAVFVARAAPPATVRDGL